jgi:hypothetical protein
MNLKDIKDIMKQVNEPNEFELFAHDLTHPYYWIFKVENVREKTLAPQLNSLRSATARFDVFINGLFISENDYLIENQANDFYIKFIKEQFPTLDRFGNPYELDETDEVKINGDIEHIF